MGRKSKTGSGKKFAAAGGGKTSINKTKKDKNIFKVADTKGKKKPKEVRVQLKKLKVTVASKQAEVDSTLKTLHEDLVTKKVAMTPSPKIPKTRKTQPDSTKVSQNLKKLQV